jgi:zinc protease
MYRVPSYAEATAGEAESLEVFAQLRGGGATGTLYRELVVKKKHAIDAGANYDGYARDDGSFSVYAIPRPGVTLENLERAVDGVIAGLFSREAAAADLERAKTQLIASATYRRDSQYALASAYGQALSIGLTANDVEQWPDRIRAVTAETVRKAAIKDLKKIEAVSGYLRPGK